MDHQRLERVPSMRPSSRSYKLPSIGERTAPSGKGAVNSANTSASKSSIDSSMYNHKMADFFGREVFQLVLHNPATAYQLNKFCMTRFCGENMVFLEQTSRYNRLLHELKDTLGEIYQDFISADAPTQLNVSPPCLGTTRLGIETSIEATQQMKYVFADAQEEIEKLLMNDIYPRFVRHQMTSMATKALGNDARQFQGLGDCFCLTDPAKADNPIVFASDGFVKVTGYRRSDIIPRNCRFLQGPQTDRTVVKGLKNAIDAPLYDQSRKVAFFLGAQINCSTTISSRSEVLRLLSTAEDVADEKIDPINQTRAAKKNGLLSSFKKSKTYVPDRVTGIEEELIDQIEGLDLKSQMDAFYTAYSKYIIISYNDMVIRFYSSGIIHTLNAQNLGGLHLVGNDIFTFLNGHSKSPVDKATKNKVKTALSTGLAISIDVYLETKRSMKFRGDEKFALHWTPVKDEKAVIAFVVLTFGAANP